MDTRLVFGCVWDSFRDEGFSQRHQVLHSGSQSNYELVSLSPTLVRYST